MAIIALLVHVFFSVKKNSNYNRVEFGNDIRAFSLSVGTEDDGNQITIGGKTTFESNNQIAACEGKRIIIGEDCMFSHDIIIRTTDSHGIYCGEQRINHGQDVEIGDHVWVGMQCLILKGANIPSGTVVGARCIVTKSTFDPNTIIVGAPAKSVKTNVVWRRTR